MNTEDKTLIGKRIREQRKKLDLTLEDIYKSTGLSKAYISNIEKEVKAPSLITFIRITNSLNISSNCILKNDDKLNKLQSGSLTSNSIHELISDLDSKELTLIIDIIQSVIKNRSIK
ncbi:helix-turn-helix domain-containing protein [Clostridioides sp. ZZV14-6345]|uniref:helix-turn-helix domain-containing protein n=1 Tax=Clostridioides sp. ZZV14-6345 TaxID=2811496 RepID=UPI001D0F58F6|nr:helix-turn-helix transcriptional regulator [Clostridioides sp. ZZV14-6345]